MEHLTIGYGGRPVLEDLVFEVALGDVFAILGGSGSGKSTLLRHLIGLEVPDGGTIRIAGATAPREGVAPQFGVLFQSGALFGSMTLFENVALPLRNGRTSTRPRSIRSCAPSSDSSGSKASSTTFQPSYPAA